MVSIVTREIPQAAADLLSKGGRHPVLARVLASRGISSESQLESSLSGLIPPQQLTHVERMASMLADAITQRKRLLVVADYDADGATAWQAHTGLAESGNEGAQRQNRGAHGLD